MIKIIVLINSIQQNTLKTISLVLLDIYLNSRLFISSYGVVNIKYINTKNNGVDPKKLINSKVVKFGIVII